jgi:hypothetical protein
MKIFRSFQAFAYSLGKINITPGHSRKRRRNMKAWNKTITRRNEREAAREKRKKSQILYFDIFYVDLDSKAELYRGFFRRFRAISHECVSCYLYRFQPNEENMST